jgi:hypothetical protein
MRYGHLSEFVARVLASMDHDGYGKCKLLLWCNFGPIGISYPSHDGPVNCSWTHDSKAKVRFVQQRKD